MSRSAGEIWEAALGELQLQVSKPNYRTWLEKTIGLSYQNNEFTIGVPNAFVAEYLDRNQRSLIEKTLIGLTQSEIKVVFCVNAQLATGRSREHSSAASNCFNPRYTFDTFIAGERNRLAKDAALKVAHNPGLIYNPLFIYGGTGLGKTHLLHAIGNAALSRNMHVLFASAEQFLTEFVSSIRDGKNEEFHNRYRNVDMLLIDDIHFIAGKKQTEESFFHTFNDLHSSNHQIVMTSDRPPKSLDLLEDRLCSRFEWGLTAGIKPPDHLTRLAILNSKAESEEIRVPPDVLELIAAKNYQNVRQLEGALNRVMAFATLIESPPTPEIAAQALEDIASKRSESAITPTLIIQAVAEGFNLAPEDIKGRKRDKETTLARHVAMYLIRKETSSSLAQIGQELGGRDHSTVIHGYQIISSSLETSPYLRRKVQEIQQSKMLKQSSA